MQRGVHACAEGGCRCKEGGVAYSWSVGTGVSGRLGVQAQRSTRRGLRGRVHMYVHMCVGHLEGEAWPAGRLQTCPGGTQAPCPCKDPPQQDLDPRASPGLRDARLLLHLAPPSRQRRGRWGWEGAKADPEVSIM